MKSIYSCDDYREFLRYVHDCGDHSRFSWRAISRRADIRNPNFLRQVMLYERNLSEKKIEPVGKALGLQKMELAYWHRLVNFCQANTEEERKWYGLELAQMQGSVKSVEITDGFAEYYSQWYIPVVRELVSLHDFKDNYKLLASSVRPPIQEWEARFAVQTLERFHFIQKDSQGRWKETHRALRSGCPHEFDQLRKYNDSMLGKASWALKNLHKNERLITGMTVGVSNECCQIILGEAKKFKNAVLALVMNDQKSDRVMQIALQIFPTGFSPGCKNE